VNNPFTPILLCGDCCSETHLKHFDPKATTKPNFFLTFPTPFVFISYPAQHEMWMQLWNKNENMQKPIETDFYGILTRNRTVKLHQHSSQLLHSLHCLFPQRLQITLLYNN